MAWQVETDSLTKVFGGNGGSLTALSGLTLRVAPSEFVSIIGPSGCGKSTLLRLIGGLLEPTSGAVHVEGRSPREAQAAKRIGFVFQDPSLLPWRTVLGNIRLPLEVNARRHTDTVPPEDLLRLVGLAGFRDYYPHQLSGGMQHRVALARALAFEPALLLMDEPLGALDEITREAMRYELLRIWERTKKTALFVTHSVTEAVALSDRVVVLTKQPGAVRDIITIALPRPRDEAMEHSERFRAYVAQLKALLR